jgi:hypothetical protein
MQEIWRELGKGLIRLPDALVCDTFDVKDSVQEVYCGFSPAATEEAKAEFLMKICIVSPTNDVVDSITDEVI